MLRLSPSETHHLRHILRLSAGDRCLVIDGKGAEAEAQVTGRENAHGAELEILGFPGGAAPDFRLYLRLCPAVPRHQKLDYLIEKAQELGVQEIWPSLSARTVVRLSAAGGGRVRKRERWARIAAEAAKQSGQGRLMDIREPLPLEDIVAATGAAAGQMVFFHPAPQAVTFPEWIAGLRDSAGAGRQALSLFFGPEGGFTDTELQRARAAARASGARFETVRLGDSILKVDTAVLGVTACLRMLFS
jgi:16S rRNA (uracil1498-N3)-methyltransferase